MSQISTIDTEHPWPGLLPFSEDARAFFHGRESETDEFFRLIERDPLSVLFGQSGLGKSSLLNAGVFPRLRRAGYLPLYLRVDLDASAAPLIEQVWETLVGECAKHEVTAPPKQPGDDLWHYLHRPDTVFRNPHGRPVTLVLAFDQFEELFTIGQQNGAQNARCQLFLRQLGELIENRLPPALEAELTQHPERQDEFDLLRHNLKIVFSFREDYLAEFEGLKTLIRPIMQNRMRLAPMTGRRAVQAICQAGDGLMSEAVADRIVRFVGGAGRRETSELEHLQVEPALLSLICRELNEKRIARKESEISADLIAGSNAQLIIENFYHQGFTGLDARLKYFVEDRLLTAAGHRDSCALENALSEPGVTESALQVLIDRRLLRREERGGLVRVELIHDVLVVVAKASRDARREANALAEARRQLARQKKRQRWMSMAAVGLVMVLTAVSWLAWEAVQFRKVAEKAGAESELQRKRAESARAESELQRLYAEGARMKAQSAEQAIRFEQQATEAALKRTAVAEELSRNARDQAAAQQKDAMHNNGLRMAEKADRAFAERRPNEGQTFAAHALARLDQSRGSHVTAQLAGLRMRRPGIPLLASLRGHDAHVSSVAFSSDDKILATGSADKTVKLWDVTTGQEVRTLRGHTELIWSVAFSADGKTLVSGSGDKTVKLWDVASGMETRTLRGHEGIVFSVAVSPDNKIVASAGDDKSIKLWDFASGQEIRSLLWRGGIVRSVAFSPDGKTLAAGGDNKTVVLWSVASGEEIRVLRGHEWSVTTVAFSPDGKFLGSGGGDKSVRLWDVASGQEVRSLRGHDWPINTVAFAPDGKTLASGGSDTTVKFWDVASGQEIRSMRGHDVNVASIAFSRNGKILASGSGDKSAKLWDVTSGQEVRILRAHEDQLTGVAFSPDGKLLASGSFDKSVKVLDTRSGQEIRQLRGHEAAITRVAFSPTGSLLGSASLDKTIKIWDLTTGLEVRSLRGHENQVSGIAFSPDGKTLASASTDKSVKLWDVASGRTIRTLRGHMGDVLSVVFSPDSKSLASASLDKVIKIWDVASGDEIRNLRGHELAVTDVAFSPDGKTLVSASADKTVKLWDVVSGAEVRNLRGHDAVVASIAFSPDGKTLASASADKTIKLWDVASGQEILSLPGHGDSVASVAFSPQGKALASASADRTLRLWPVSTELQDVTNWSVEAAKDEARYGLKLEGISLVPYTPAASKPKP